MDFADFLKKAKKPHAAGNSVAGLSLNALLKKCRVE